MKWWPTFALIVLTACSTHRPPQPKLPPNPPGITSKIKSAKVLVPPAPRRYQLIWEYDQPDTIFSVFISTDLKTWDMLGDTVEHAYPIDIGQEKSFFMVGVQ